MSENKKALAKGFVLGTVLKKNSNLTKAYLALVAASIYGIRAAREANSNADKAVGALFEEKKRPVVHSWPAEPTQEQIDEFQS